MHTRWPRIAAPRWNYYVLGVDLAIFLFGMQISSFNVIIPLFITTLSRANWPVTLAMALYNLGDTVPGVIAAFSLERSLRLKPALRRMALLQRLPFLALGVVAFSVGRAPALVALLFVFALVLAQAIGQGLVSTTWFDIVSRAVNADRLSRFVGSWTSLGTLLGLAGALIATVMLSRDPYPTNFAFCFLLTFALLVCSFAVQQSCREPARSVHQPAHIAPNWRAYMSDIRVLLHEDGRFRRYLLFSMLSASATFGSALYIPVALRQAAMTPAEVSGELAPLQLAMAVGAALGGFVSERGRPRYTLIAGQVCGMLAALCAVFAHGALLITCAIWLFGFSLAGLTLGRQIYPIRYSAEERRPLYLGLNGIAIAPFAVLAPLVGGFLADRWGYGVPYTLDIALGLAALALAARLAPGARARSTSGGMA